MKRLENAIKNIAQLEPPFNLEGAVLRQIKLEAIKQTRRKLMFSLAGVLGSIVLGIYTTITFGQAFLNSDFFSVISLAFSDLNVVAGHWSDFLDSLAETFPALTVVAILIPVFTLFLSISFYLDSDRNHHKYI